MPLSTNFNMVSKSENTESDSTYLKCISYNCTGFNISVISQLLDRKPDILFLQELWHNPAHYKKLIKCAGDHFCLIEHSTVDINAPPKAGRASSGLAFYINKMFSHSVTVIEKNKRYICLKIGKIFVCNIYMPCCVDSESEDSYTEVIDSITSHFLASGSTKMLLGGDFNTGYLYAERELRTLLSNYELTDLSLQIDYTFESAHLSTSKIDYFIGHKTQVNESRRLDSKDIHLEKSGPHANTNWLIQGHQHLRISVVRVVVVSAICVENFFTILWHFVHKIMEWPVLLLSTAAAAEYIRR